jgi:hypothetical protein
VGLKDSAHENARTTAPHTRLNQVARNSLPNYILDTLLQVVQPLQTNHRVGVYTVITARQSGF